MRLGKKLETLGITMLPGLCCAALGLGLFSWAQSACRSHGGKRSSKTVRLSRSDRERMAREVKVNIKALKDAALAYFETEHSDRMGNVLPRQFPPSAGPTPAKPCCKEPGGVCRNVDWSAPTWKILHFPWKKIEQRYQYQLISKGKGKDAVLTIRAYGDLDCDGIRSTYDIVLKATSDGNYAVSTPIMAVHPLE